MIRVIIADDHPLLREGIRKIVEASSDICVIGETGTLAGLLGMIRQNPPDVVSLDLSLGDVDGLTVLSRLRNEFPDVAVLIVTMHPAERYGLAALRAGAAGYVDKAMAAEDVVTALRSVGKGARYISQRLAELLADELMRERPVRPANMLTPREQEVVRLLGSGLKPKQVAASMGISLSSVNTYRSRISSKTGLTSSAAIIRFALQKGLVT